MLPAQSSLAVWCRLMCFDAVRMAAAVCSFLSCPERERLLLLTGNWMRVPIAMTQGSLEKLGVKGDRTQLLMLDCTDMISCNLHLSEVSASYAGTWACTSEVESCSGCAVFSSPSSVSSGLTLDQSGSCRQCLLVLLVKCCPPMSSRAAVLAVLGLIVCYCRLQTSLLTGQGSAGNVSQEPV